MVELTEGTKALFIEYLEDSPNWSWSPRITKGNVETSLKNNGHLTDMIKKGLVETFENEPNEYFMDFTQLGIDYARSIGLNELADKQVEGFNNTLIMYGSASTATPLV